jgi:N-methylhydantoinase A/oxoprolinase/acetone carboxylase beta subunit
VFIESFILKAIVPVRKIQLPKMRLEKPDPAAARKGERPVYWAGRNDFVSTTLYSYEQLRPGNVVEGPAVIEGEYTTLVVPASMRFSVDERGLGFLEEQ